MVTKRPFGHLGLPREASATWRDILAWATKKKSGFTSGDVAKAFGLRRDDASWRLTRFSREPWNVVRRVERLADRSYLYELTAWGKRVAKGSKKGEA